MKLKRNNAATSNGSYVSFHKLNAHKVSRKSTWKKLYRRAGRKLSRANMRAAFKEN